MIIARLLEKMSSNYQRWPAKFLYRAGAFTLALVISLAVTYVLTLKIKPSPQLLRKFGSIGFVSAPRPRAPIQLTTTTASVQDDESFHFVPGEIVSRKNLVKVKNN